MYERAKGPRRRARLLLASFAAVALGALGSASAAAALPADFWGVVPQLPPTTQDLRVLKRGGVDSMRVPVSWSSVQPDSPREWNWSDADTLIGAAAEARVDVLPFLSSAPGWAVPSDPRVGSSRFLPVRNGRQRGGWKRFVAAAIRRYGPRGAFWRQHPELPRLRIHIWQVWNEPNFKYFVARPNPKEYGKLVNLTYAAARSADPRAKLILGGLFARPIEATFKVRPRQAYFASTFLQRMYATTPGIRRKFQGVALHPYTGSWKNLPGRIGEVRRVLARNHDARKPLFITEMGWSSEPPRKGNSFAKGLRGQARELKGAFRLLKRNQRRWHIQGVYWFSINDYAGLCNFCGGAGLFHEDQAKPAWHAYKRFAR
jgi:hypothetical protein